MQPHPQTQNTDHRSNDDHDANTQAITVPATEQPNLCPNRLAQAGYIVALLAGTQALASSGAAIGHRYNSPWWNFTLGVAPIMLGLCAIDPRTGDKKVFYNLLGIGGSWLLGAGVQALKPQVEIKQHNIPMSFIFLGICAAFAATAISLVTVKFCCDTLFNNARPEVAPLLSPGARSADIAPIDESNTNGDNQRTLQIS